MSQIRQTQSKLKIREALLELLNEKDFAKISVADITRVADINRGTFYLHYIDKFDLIEQVVNELKNNLYQILLNENEPAETNLFKGLLYIRQEKELIKTLESSSAASISKEIESFLIELFSRNADFREEILSKSNIPENYLLTSFSGSVTSMIVYWLNHDCQDSSEELSHLLTAIRGLYQ